MTNKAISQLDNADALSGDDLFAIVQEGSNVKTTAQHVASYVVHTNSNDLDDLGPYSIAFGPNAAAPSYQSIAIGRSAYAEDAEGGGNTAIAIGNYATTASNQTIAIGRNARSNQFQSLAIGKSAHGYGEYGLAIGTQAEVTGLYGVAIGAESQCSGNRGVAIGKSSYGGESAVAIGNQTGSLGYYAIGLGTGNLTTGVSAITIGYNLQNYADNAIVIGSQASIPPESQASITFGIGSSNFVPNGIAMGTGVTTGGLESIAIGYHATSYGNYGVAVGSFTNSEGGSSIAIGKNTTALGDYGIALGYRTFAFSDNTITIGKYAGSEGSGAISVGRQAITEGYGAVAIGSQSAAFTNYSCAIGYDSFAENAGVAIGAYASSEAVAAVAIGYGTRAAGLYSTAIGYNCSAMGSNSMAFGEATAMFDRSVVFGGQDIVGNSFVVRGTQNFYQSPLCPTTHDQKFVGVTIAGTDATVGFDGVDYSVTIKHPGSAANDLFAMFMNVGANTTLQASLQGNTLIVFLGTDSDGTITSTIDDIAALFPTNDFTMEVTGNTTTLASVFDSTQLSGGVDTIDEIILTTDGNSPSVDNILAIPPGSVARVSGSIIGYASGLPNGDTGDVGTFSLPSIFMVREWNGVYNILLNEGPPFVPFILEQFWGAFEMVQPPALVQMDFDKIGIAVVGIDVDTNWLCFIRIESSQ